ncbi:hypothetical protein AW27_023425 [Streptomyces sp. PCS3-D2]|uniref:hypothetical protein n=1 Tax=Streptomyces sp. PCS3-D2 TaxID=1460244 RepID=UPI00045271E1|nr:hypothetical protein [Streptomyces sp. PCS3-D2]WKV74195.1 hypothetical protein AW27_023425 [Streptomyces sp. PCS3-D2]
MNDSSSAPSHWASMTTADFDTDAPLALAVPPGPARIVAAQHRSGTDALFGDEPAVPPASRTPKVRRAPGPGQAELFDAAP